MATVLLLHHRDEGQENSSETHFPNGTRDYPHGPDIRAEYYPMIVPMMIVLCFLGILANLYILVCVRWLRKSPSPVMVLTISLAAADGCVAFFNLLSIFLTSFLDFVVNIETFYVSFCLYLTLEAFRMGTMVTAILHLFTIALNHYAGSLRPLHYQVKMTKRVLRSLLVCLWTIPTLGFLLAFGLFPSEGYRSTGCLSVRFLMAFLFRFVVFLMVSIPLFSMCGIYSHIFMIMSRRRKNSQVSESLRRGSVGSIGRNRKAVLTTSLILGTYIIGWVPSILTFVLICEQDCPFSIRDVVMNHPLVYLCLRTSVQTLIILKTVVNPVVYALRVHEIQVAIKRMNAHFCCREGPLRDSYEDLRAKSSVNSRRFSNAIALLRKTDSPVHTGGIRKCSLSNPVAFTTRKKWNSGMNGHSLGITHKLDEQFVKH